MVSQGYKDFIGFTLDGNHSYDLGVIRTSDGSGFTLNPLPSTREYTTSIVGRDGERYWGREFGTTTIDFTIAYDNLTEANMRKLQKILKKKDPVPLIFDEMPYKVYYVVATNNCRLDYVCFNNPSSETTVTDLYSPNAGESGRVYKGEGTLKFDVYDPFAHCDGGKTGIDGKKFIDDIYYNSFPYKAEWNGAVNLLQAYTYLEYTGTIPSSTETIFEYNTTSQIYFVTTDTERDPEKTYYYRICNIDTWRPATNNFLVYNPGDKVTCPIIRIPMTYVSGYTAQMTLSYNNTAVMTISDLVLNSEDSGIEINNELQLIRGWTGTAASSNIYNGYISSGTFFTIPEITDSTAKTLSLIYTTGSTRYVMGTPTIEYDYLFL